jgi:hypothetical protein
MKTFAGLVFILGASLAGAAPVERAVVGPATASVTVPAPVSELAEGYAAASQQMSIKSLTIYIKADEQTKALKGIRSVQALKGVLLIVFAGGDSVAVSAKKVVMISDGAREP